MPSTAAVSSQPSRNWLPALAAALLTLALYAVTLGGTYIYDDIQIIQIDKRMHDPSQWSQIWTKDYFNGAIDNLYRPLVSQSYALQMWLHGDRPWAFHLVNLLLAAAVSALVAELGRRLAGCRAGLLAGLLFSAHPVHVEAIAGIVGRAELACAAAMLGAFILFLHRPLTTRRALAIGLLCVIALLCKEQGMLIPFILLPLALFRRHAPAGDSPSSPPDKNIPVQPLDYSSHHEPSGEANAMKWLIVAVVWPVSVLIVLREQVLHLPFEWDRGFLDWTIQPMIHSRGIDRILLPLQLLGRYVRLLLWPSRLSIDYGAVVLGSHVDGFNPYLILGIASASLWLILAILSLWRRWWAVLFCLLAAAVTYAMVSNVILIGTIFGERLIYLPSAFLLILLAIPLARLPRNFLLPLMILLLTLASVRTFTYAARWNNIDQFYQTSLIEQPQSIRLHLLVAQRMDARGDYPAARKIMTDACRLAPSYYDNWRTAGLIEQHAGNWALAEQYFKKAYDCQPTMSLDHLRAEAHKMVEAQQHPTTQNTTRP